VYEQTISEHTRNQRKACSESVNVNSVKHNSGASPERFLISRQSYSLISNRNPSNSEFLYPFYSRILSVPVLNYFKSNPHLSCLFNTIIFIMEDTRWRSWLRRCATSRKVAGSIPDVIAIFHRPNPSGRTMGLGLISL
jgi:hypothetical protein